MNKRVVDCLKRAKGLLVKYGWVQHRYGNEETGFCASAAIIYASKSGEVNLESQLALLNVVGGGIVPWNDHPGRRKRTVLAAFDRAIKKAQHDSSRAHRR